MSVDAQLHPQGGILVQAQHGGGERRLIFGHQHVVAIAQLHAFDRRAGSHHRLAVGHAQVHLALDPGAVAQRGDRDPAAIHVGSDVGHIAVHHHAFLPGQGLDLRYHVAADAVEAHVRQGRADGGEDRLHEPAHRVHVRRVAEAAHEHQVAPLLERQPGPGDAVQVGNQLHPHAGRIAGQQVALGRADHQGHVAAGHHAQFEGAGAGGGPLQFFIAGQVRRALLAQVVQVHAVEHHLGLGRVFAQQRQQAAGHIVAAGDHAGKTRAVGTQPRGHAAHVRRVPGFNAQPLQPLGIAARMAAVGRHEHHVRALVTQQPHQVHHPQRA